MINIETIKHIAYIFLKQGEYKNIDGKHKFYLNDSHFRFEQRRSISPLSNDTNKYEFTFSNETEIIYEIGNNIFSFKIIKGDEEEIN